MVIITGNPFAFGTKKQVNAFYATLELELSKNLSAVVINDRSIAAAESGVFGLRIAAMKKRTNQHFPYPNPIKLLNKE